VSVSSAVRIRSPRDWQRKYPPLVAIAVAALIAIVVLPSALNLPQTNPTRTLEYAPVPPSDSNATPPNGNFSSLGLASTSGLETGGALGGDNGLLPPPPEDPLAHFRPDATKRCVNGHQTEDPLSPPCVAYFNGDNFGSTYQGVTGTDVRILIYVDGNLNYIRGSEGSEVTPDHQYFDLGKEPTGHEHVLVRAFRDFQTYFNDRYQTYNRFVHFYMYFGSTDQSEEARRGEAVDNYSKVQPFAVLIFAEANAEAYLQVMAEHHVLNFGSFVGHDQSFFQQFPKLIWGYQPSLQTEARSYVSYVCNKVVGFPATRAGGTLANNNPRTFGLVYYKPNPGYPDKHPELETFDQIVESQLKSQCGVTVPARYRFPFPDSGYAADTQFTPDYAVQAMTALKAANITTILWPGGYETNFSKEANTINYAPEWIILGDGVSDSDAGGIFQDSNTWTDHAWVVTSQPLNPSLRSTLCYQALKQADPDYQDGDAAFACADFSYELLRQLFTGIQVAGPRLGPTSIDKGYHAIPAVQSTSNLVPACYYEPGDYTCIKDGAAEYWDGNRTAPSFSEPGCWVMVEAGKRYLSGQWPKGNIDTDFKPNDQADNICNNYGGTYLINNQPPTSKN